MVSFDLTLFFICSLCFEKSCTSVKCASESPHSTLGLLPPIVIRKRGETFKLDLNMPAPTDEGVSASPSEPDRSVLASELDKDGNQKQQVVSQLAESDPSCVLKKGHKPNPMVSEASVFQCTSKTHVIRQSPEERRKRKIERSGFLRRQKSAMLKEA